MMEKFNLEHVELWYNDFKALKDVTMSISANEITALIGPSGCGKSTLLKSLNRMNDLIEGCKIVGSIQLDGKEIYQDPDVNGLRKRVGMVFQNPDNQIVSSIVEEDVAFGVENLGVEPKECRRRVDAALKTVGMYAEWLKSPSKLSGGQKQRVAIASAIVSNREIIVFDEPTSGLDLKHMREVARSLKSLADQGKTLLVITHDPELVMAGCSYVVHMEKGQIKESYPLDESGSKKVLDFFRIRQ